MAKWCVYRLGPTYDTVVSEHKTKKEAQAEAQRLALTHTAARYRVAVPDFGGSNMSGSMVVTASNVKELDNYTLYRVWSEATTARERSLAMKEIKRRQKMGNMAVSHYPQPGMQSIGPERGYGQSGSKFSKNAMRIHRVLTVSSESPRYIQESLGLTKAEYDKASKELIKAGLVKEYGQKYSRSLSLVY